MKRIALVTLLLLSLVVAAAYWYTFGRGASLGEGLRMEAWSGDLIEDIPVALDVAPDGRVFVVETGQFAKGVGDNRAQTYWFEADMLSTSTADRLAYIKQSIADGHIGEDFFDAKDQVKVLEDSDGDGLADKATVFAEYTGYLEGVTAGVMVSGDDVYVTSIPRLHRYTDSDGDSRPDSEEILSEGYGLRTAFVGHDLHGLTWGPDGKIYFSVADRGFNVTTQEGEQLLPPMDEGRGAVLRMNPDGSALEVFAVGLRNPQELAFDNYGNLITGDNNSDGDDEARIVYVVEGGDSGWTYGYQYMEAEDYLRGPWNAEKLWHPYHEGQPAWIVPPLANETNGPSGLAFYPGLGLPQRYSEHFFLANYSFIKPGSYILSFALEEDGAGFSLRDTHRFVDNELFIDQGFGYDGKLYAIAAPVFGGDKTVYRISAEEADTDPRIGEVQSLFQQGFAQQSDAKLLALLGHADQRVRLHSQFALAKRSHLRGALQAIAADAKAPELKRLHALWALVQQGSLAGLDAGKFDGELLAQYFRGLGDVLDVSALGVLAEAAGIGNARQRYLAVMSLGKLLAGVRDKHPQRETAVQAIVSMLAENDNRDAFLRHAGVFALEKMADADTVAALSAHTSSAVRLAAVVALRRYQDARLALFLNDEEAAVVVEAARAIHDMRIAKAMPVLAALADGGMPASLRSSEEAQTALALHRRVINANLLTGGAEQASRLARYALNQAYPQVMRVLALESLGEFTQPARADAVWGDHQIHAPRPESQVHEAIDQYLAKLLQAEASSKQEKALADVAMKVALAYERVPLADDKLMALLEDAKAGLNSRLNALNTLAQRVASGGEGAEQMLRQAVSIAENSQLPALRARALEVLADVDAALAMVSALALLESASQELEVQNKAPSLSELQSAVAVLASIGGEQAKQWLRKALDTVPQGLRLDVVMAMETIPELAPVLEQWRQAQLQAYGPFAERQLAISGGDAVRGKSLFDNRGDCLRCHAVDGRGGVAGPDLTGIAARFADQYLLDALVQPAKDIAAGYAAVSLSLVDGSQVSGILMAETETDLLVQQDTGHGKPVELRISRADIASQQGPFSGMPPMGLVLSVQDLRDVMAYLSSLR